LTRVKNNYFITGYGGRPMRQFYYLEELRTLQFQQRLQRGSIIARLIPDRTARMARHREGRAILTI